MPRFLLSLFIVSSIWAQQPPPAAARAATVSAYDVLRSHGLPAGLLPKGVKDFSVDEAGQFKLRIERPCTAKFETDVHYDAEVAGIISYGQMASITGVSAQELFLWFPVREIRVDVPSSGLIYFDVGVVSRQFSLSLFETPRDCLPADIPDDYIGRLVDKRQPGELRYHLDNQEEADDGELAAL